MRLYEHPKTDTYLIVGHNLVIPFRCTDPAKVPNYIAQALDPPNLALLDTSPRAWALEKQLATFGYTMDPVDATDDLVVPPFKPPTDPQPTPATTLAPLNPLPEPPNDDRTTNPK